MQMFDAGLRSGITRRFRDVESDLPVETDDDGFIISSPYSLTIEQILTGSAVLVRGQPWIGKTHVANEITKQQATLMLGDYLWYEPLDKHTSGRPLKPPWWDEWLCNPEKRACWIIDSVDEGELIQPNIHTVITGLLKETGRRACQRLKVIMFVREADVPEGLNVFLRSYYGDSYSNVELLPLDRETAGRIVETGHWDATFAIIRKFSLQSVARYPAGLKYISGHISDSSLSEVEVWRGILMELLRERNQGVPRRQVSLQEIEHQFRTAAHLAVVMTFAEVQHLSIAKHGPDAPDVTDLISADPSPMGPTRAAARDAMKTAMFHNGRFSQKNIREWMCAFGLASIGLSRLKPLITDSDGNLERKHFGVLSLLHKTTLFSDEVGRWLVENNGGVPPQSDVKLNIDEAIAIIDRLESIADSTQWNINMWGERGLNHLNTPGIGCELATRIADSSRSANRRELLIQIAIETNAREILPTAIALVQDSTADEEIRQTALGCVFQIGTESDLLQFEAFIRDAQPETRVEKLIVSALIKYYLNRKIWPIEECAKYAPEPENDIIDSTHMLSRMMQESMTIEAARIFVDRRLPKILGRHGRRKGRRSRAEQRDNALFQSALEKLLLQDPPSNDDLTTLMPLALRSQRERYELAGNVDFRSAFIRSTEMRRKIFLEEIRRNARRKPGNRRRDYIWILSPEDVEWLMERVVQLAKKDDAVWSELLRMARGAPLALKRRTRALVRQHRPDIVTQSDKILRRHRQRERRRTEQREIEERKREEEQIQITDAVQELLESDKLSLQEMMWKLSWVCFGGDQGRPYDVVGTWDDLAKSLKDAVLDICQEALESCEPTIIPDGSTFSSCILYEAWCFRDVVLLRPDSMELTPELISKWLPSMFIVDIEREKEVTGTCYHTSRKATEDVFLDAIKRDLRNESEHMIRAENLDEEYWSPRLAAEIASLTVDTKYAERSRACLLRILTVRAPETADMLLRDTLRTSASAVMQNAALDSLLRIDVEAAWPYVQADYKKRGKAALINLRSLFNDRRSRISIESPGWTAVRLLELARILHATFPPNKDPQRDGLVTPEHEFSDIRESIPRILFLRNDEGDREALRQLIIEKPHLKNWHDQVQAQEEAKDELARAALPATDGPSFIRPPSYKKIVTLMENADYRIIRNEDDLLDVLEEELRWIGSEASRYIEMLYLPDEISDGPKRRHESALQSYIECRLTDRLPGRILDIQTTISIHRERQIGFRNRTDIEVNAPLLHSGLGRVVIEVKWSDNSDISTAQKKQLGDRYLLGDDKTHGIYLVGWNGCLGTWRREAGKRPKKPFTPEDLETELLRQSREYMNDHDGIQIRPIVIDLAWPDQ